MARTVKAPEVRRREIIDAAIHLFAAKGYAATAVTDILDAVGIAKGTFYHHFSSKDEVMRAVVLQVVEQGTAKAEAIAADADTPAVDRFLSIIAAQRLGGDEAALVDALHETGNLEFHVLSHVAAVNRLAPILGRVVRHGIDDGVFDVEFPEEAVAILLSAAFFLTDAGFEGYTPDPERLMPALLISAARLLGAADETFLERAHLLEGP